MGRSTTIRQRHSVSLLNPTRVRSGPSNVQEVDDHEWTCARCRTTHQRRSPQTGPYYYLDDANERPFCRICINVVARDGGLVTVAEKLASLGVRPPSPSPGSQPPQASQPPARSAREPGALSTCPDCAGVLVIAVARCPGASAEPWHYCTNCDELHSPPDSAMVGPAMEDVEIIITEANLPHRDLGGDP